MKYVIIGNSAAAVGCVEAIRRQDAKGSITIVSKERQHTYSRPLISYWLGGKVCDGAVNYRGENFYKEYKVKTILGMEAKQVQPDVKQVVLADGSTLPYDRLLLATGSDPAVPPIPGLDKVKAKFTFQSMDDVEAIRPHLGPKKKVLIMGAGLIGLKAAEALAGKVGSITVVDLADRVLPSILNTPAAEIVRDHIAAQGVTFHLGDGVKEFRGSTAVLGSGKEVPFNLVLVCVGVRPGTALAEKAGIQVERGIVTGPDQQTSVAGIYAAGDCTVSLDCSSGQRKILALLPAAYMQGEVAGANMAGGSASYENAIPMNAIGFFGLHLITAGSYTGELHQRRDGSRYKGMFIQDNRLKGYILVEDIARAGIYTSLIREQVPLGKLDMELFYARPQLMMLGKRERVKLLSGVEG